jgi:ribosomal protein S18 acetylase RimI-like enzyme
MPRLILKDPGDFIDWREGSGRTIEIFDIAVNTVRREGKGRQLLDKLRSAIPTDTSLIFAITRCSNEIAQQFYESNGFRIVGRLHRFYQDGPEGTENALMYGLDV